MTAPAADGPEREARKDIDASFESRPLRCRSDRGRHGLIEPSTVMKLAAYRSALGGNEAELEGQMARAVLEAYLDLEKRMLQLDAASDPAADLIRDAMDPLWDQLDEGDRAQLNARGFVELLPNDRYISVGNAYCGQPEGPDAWDPAVCDARYEKVFSIPLDDVVEAA